MLKAGFFLNLVGISFVILAISNLPIDIWYQLISQYWKEMNPYVKSFNWFAFSLVIFWVAWKIQIVLSLKLHNYLYGISYLLAVLSVGLLIVDKTQIYVIDDYLSVTWTSIVIMLLSYCINVVANRIEMEKGRTDTIGGYATPLNKLSEDKLERKYIYNRITYLIERTPCDWTTKISICGRWGEGKTSILKWVNTWCREEGHCVLVFNPWKYRDKSEMWKGFRIALEIGLIDHCKGYLQTSLWNRLKLTVTTVAESKLPIGKMMDHMFSYSGTPYQDLLRKEIDLLLESYVDKTKKIVIFIDDADRLDDSKVVLDLLMGLNELINFRRVFIILAYDEEILIKILEKQLPRKSGQLFLDKFIDFKFNIPGVTVEGVKKLVLNELSQSDIQIINQQALLSIAEYLPQNPRVVKRFIHFIKAIQVTLNQFDDDEINWPLLYTCQLIAWEFPVVINKVLNNPDGEEMFTSTSATAKSLSSNSDDKEMLKPFQYLGLNLNQNKRLVELINLFYLLQDFSQGYFYNVAYYFTIANDPGVMGKNMFLNLYKEIKKNPIGFSSLDLTNKTRYILNLVAYRLFYLDKLESAVLEEDVQKWIQEIRDIVIQINSFLSREFYHDMLMVRRVEMLKGLINQYSKICKSSYVYRFTELKTDTRLIIKKITLLNQDNPVELFDSIHFGRIKAKYRLEPDTLILLNELEKDLEEAVVNKIFEYFKSELSIHKIFTSSQIGILRCMLAEKSAFHTKENYRRLEKCFNEAANNEVIWRNVYDYLRFLIICAQEPPLYLHKSKTLELLNDIDFLNLLWRTINIRHLSRNQLESFKNDFLNLQKDAPCLLALINKEEVEQTEINFVGTI